MLTRKFVTPNAMPIKTLRALRLKKGIATLQHDKLTGPYGASRESANHYGQHFVALFPIGRLERLSLEQYLLPR